MSPPSSTGPKARLVCPTCGREAPPADWRHRRRDSRRGRQVAYECPRCDAVLTCRPPADGGHARVLAGADR